MDSTQDVILGVLSGQQYVFSYPGVEVYLESLRRCGYRGRKVMLVWDINLTTRNKLLEFGFEIVDLMPWPSDRFFHARMRICWEYLRDHSDEFRYVFWFDIKDFLFQTNPSIWMEKHIGNYGLVGSTECVTIEQEETNRLWAKEILGEDKFQEIKNEEVINGGTWAGKADLMREVFHQVHLGCKDYSGPYPPCQIWINYVLRQQPFKKELMIPRWSSGFAACLHPCWSPWRTPCWPHMRDPHPTLDMDTVTLYPGTVPNRNRKMILFSSDWGRYKPLQFSDTTDPLHGVEINLQHTNEPFCVVHGYDRDWSLKALFDYKYAFGSHRNRVTMPELIDEVNKYVDKTPQRRSLRPRRFQ